VPADAEETMAVAATTAAVRVINILMVVLLHWVSLHQPPPYALQLACQSAVASSWRAIFALRQSPREPFNDILVDVRHHWAIHTSKTVPSALTIR
jgi:hypothetical protein